jgi:membrane protease YdiL (CAAX protease family)
MKMDNLQWSGGENYPQIDEKKEPNKKQIRRVFSRIAMGLGIMIIVAPVLAVIAIFLVSNFISDAEENINVLLSVTLLSQYAIGIIIYLTLKKWAPAKELGVSDSMVEVKQPVRLTPFNMGKLVLISLAVGFIFNMLTMGINYVINLISHFIEVRETIWEYLETGYGTIPDPPYFMEVDPLMDMIGGLNPALSFLFIVVFTSFFEEFIFRKLLYDKLIVFGGKVFIIVSSLLFALFHVNHHQLLYAFGIGLVFAGVMYYTKKVSYCILLHMFFNFFGTIAIYIGTFPETVVTIYTYLYSILIIIGVVLLVKWLITARRSVKFEPAKVKVGKVKNVFLNPGMIIFLILTIGSMIINTMV